MTTNSYPAVGTGGLTDAQWSNMYASRDGIIEDYVGTACKLTRNNGTNMATVAPGKVSVNGFVLDITVAHDLYCAPVLSGTVVYSIVVQYDPALNVAEVGGERSTLGPCRLLIVAGALDATGGKRYVTLYTITRTVSQLLASAALFDYRRWVGTTLEMDDYLGVGAAYVPRGSVVFQSGLGEFSVRALNAAGTALTWVSFSRTTATPFPAAGSLVAFDHPAEMFKYAGVMVALRGTLKRATGNLNNGADVILGTLPIGWRPSAIERFSCYAFGSSANPRTVGVKVTSDGKVTMYDTGAPDYSFIDLSAIKFRAEG